MNMTLDQIPKIPCRQVADIELPSEIDGLYDLAYNLWWSWTREARQLFWKFLRSRISRSSR